MAASVESKSQEFDLIIPNCEHIFVKGGGRHHVRMDEYMSREREMESIVGYIISFEVFSVGVALRRRIIRIVMTELVKW